MTLAREADFHYKQAKLARRRQTMNDGTPHLHWERLYHKAILETDREKTLENIAAAHKAIIDRIEELLSKPACGEHTTLNEALRFLRLLEKNSAKQNVA